VVNETFARYYYKSSADAVGRRVGWGRTREGYQIEIIGVVKDNKEQGLRDQAKRYIYTPLSQSEIPNSAVYYVRALGAPESITAAVRRAVTEADPGVPVTDLKTLTRQLNESLFTDRLVAGLSAAFGLLATLLAAIGLYGVTSWSVTQRTQEIGIRMALGAERWNVLALVLREVGALAAFGIVTGLPLALVLAHLVRSQLFGVGSADPHTLLAATASLAGVTLVAGLLPARRAMRVEPIVALRYE
jgi:predicted lysophospholipase L1 biosynthesis ABC-type transport system permease subunit